MPQSSVADSGYFCDAYSWYERGEPHGRYKDDWVARRPYPNSRNYYDNSYNSRYLSDNPYYKAGYYDEFDYDRRYGLDRNRCVRGEIICYLHIYSSSNVYSDFRPQLLPTSSLL